MRVAHRKPSALPPDTLVSSPSHREGGKRHRASIRETFARTVGVMCIVRGTAGHFNVRGVLRTSGTYGYLDVRQDATYTTEGQDEKATEAS